MKKIEINSKSFQNALAKAKSAKPMVRLGAASPERAEYFLDGSRGNRYTVVLIRSNGGSPLCSCDCAAGENDMFCYHVAAGLLAHSPYVLGGLRPALVAAPAFAVGGDYVFAASLDYRGDDSVRNLI